MNENSFVTPAGDRLLAEIETHLTQLFGDAKAGHAEFLRYYGAAFRYFRGLLRDNEAAKDLTNQLAERFLKGDFARFDPAKGRFRDFLKMVIRNMTIDHQRRRLAEALDDQSIAADESDATFDSAWREELLHQTWRTLEQRQPSDGQFLFAALKLKTEEPKLRSTELAARLAAMLGKSVTPTTARQWLHRARDLFQDLLLEEVAQSIGVHSRERLVEELESVRLLHLCQAALDRRFAAS